MNIFHNYITVNSKDEKAENGFGGWVGFCELQPCEVGPCNGTVMPIALSNLRILKVTTLFIQKLVVMPLSVDLPVWRQLKKIRIFFFFRKNP